MRYGLRSMKAGRKRGLRRGRGGGRQADKLRKKGGE